MEETTLFNVDHIHEALIETTLDEIYTALKEKGYNPISQIVGYLVTGDPSYITSAGDARKKMLSLDRGELLEIIVRKYLEG